MYKAFLTLLIVTIAHTIFAAEAVKMKKVQTKSKPISALILFMGDLNSKYQFDGILQQEIQGEFVDTAELKSDRNCEISARFQIVSYQKNPSLKINFLALCQTGQIKEKTILNPEYVRLKDLKTHSSSVYVSEQHKNVQFKIIDLSY